jgi:hypothetical protein
MLFAVPVHANDIVFYAKGASYFRLIGEVCNANVERAHRYEANLSEQGTKSFGREAYTDALNSELKILRDEISAADASQWCKTLQTYFRRMGIEDLFKN